MRQISSQAKGIAQVARLEAWITVTPLDRIPRNQFGGVARRRVCLLLEISPSTVTSNQRLRKLFDALDASIASTGAKVSEPPRHGVAIYTYETLSARCEQLEREISVLTSRLQMFEHMTTYGWSLP
ncbi:hypothetical protein AWB71_02795 [Caballeronia peredens]|nr:hypothetical protein AWB71_02795 [Caballeronia peredens]